MKKLDIGIDTALILLGLLTILAAIFIKNRYAKLAILAFEVLP